MTWTAAHLLDVIALIFAVISGGVAIWPQSDGRLAPGLLVVSVILLAIAGLVGGLAA